MLRAAVTTAGWPSSGGRVGGSQRGHDHLKPLQRQGRSGQHDLRRGGNRYPCPVARHGMVTA
jgi:hypothetical protein